NANPRAGERSLEEAHPVDRKALPPQESSITPQSPNSSRLSWIYRQLASDSVQSPRGTEPARLTVPALIGLAQLLTRLEERRGTPGHGHDHAHHDDPGAGREHDPRAMGPEGAPGATPEPPADQGTGGRA